MVSKIRSLFLHVRQFVRVSFTQILIIVFRFSSKKITLSYNEKAVSDGFGAQLHRVFSLANVANAFGFSFEKPKLESLTIHPLDKYKTMKEMRDYLDQINPMLFQGEYFGNKLMADRNFQVESLKLNFLFFLLVRSLFSRKKIRILCCDAHSVSDCFVNNYKAALRQFFPTLLAWNETSKSKTEIVVHYRRGPGEFAVYPGQKISRELKIEYYLESISRILEASKFPLRIVVFTDAPKEKIAFRPPIHQAKLWEGSPGFSNGEVTYFGSDIEKYLFEELSHKKNLSDILILRESDPLSMIRRMSQARYLIISRSSLSYVAGLINLSGEIHYPPEFWHPKLRHWKFMRLRK
jgi:hypothetical protein